MIDADNIGFGIGNENAIKRMFDYGVEPFPGFRQCRKNFCCIRHKDVPPLRQRSNEALKGPLQSKYDICVYRKIITIFNY